MALWQRKFSLGIQQSLVTSFCCAGFVFAAQSAFAECESDLLRVRSDERIIAFSIELADTDATRAKGLMFRKSMPMNNGMLFIYPYPQAVAFWMRNTLIPLDMLFIDQTGRVAKIHNDAKILDETPIYGGDSVFAVLEINAGMSEAKAIKVGDVVQHPSFDKTQAAWPCQ